MNKFSFTDYGARRITSLVIDKDKILLELLAIGLSEKEIELAKGMSICQLESIKILLLRGYKFENITVSKLNKDKGAKQ